MFEKRPWGTYQVIDISEFQNEYTSLTKKLTIKPNHYISYQTHQFRHEIWTIVDGEGILVIEGERKHVQRGDVISINIGQKHAIKALTKMTIIEVQHGTNLVEEDIERYDYSWE